MRRANTIGADKYFHARGNYEAARRGTGGRHAAAVIRLDCLTLSAHVLISTRTATVRANHEIEP